MVFSSIKIVSAAKLSAEVWQKMACFGEQERIEGQQMLDLVLCFPLQQLGRLILCVWTYLCFSPQPYYYSYNDDSSDDSENSDDFSSSSSSLSGTYYQPFYHQQVRYDDSPSD